MSSKKWLICWFAGLALVFVAMVPYLVLHPQSVSSVDSEQTECEQQGGWYWDSVKGCMPEEAREPWSAPPVPSPSEPPATTEGQDTGQGPVIVHKDGDNDDHWTCSWRFKCHWHW